LPGDAFTKETEFSISGPTEINGGILQRFFELPCKRKGDCGSEGYFIEKL
jgi:hypothetical protein